jgi:hypothetical protein
MGFPKGNVALFHAIFLSHRAADVIYIDYRAKEGLLGAIHKLRFWEGADRRVVHGHSLYELQRLVAWVPHASLEMFTNLRRLQRQNTGLKTDLR